MECPTPQKRGYASEREAKRVRASRISKGNRMRVYACPCGCWHLAGIRRSAVA